MNQQLIDFIKKEYEQGSSKEQIKSKLVANGWREQDVEEGLNSVQPAAAAKPVGPAPTKKSKAKWEIIAGIAILVVVLAVAGYIAFQLFMPNDSLPSNQITNTPSQNNTNQPPVNVSGDQSSVKDCGVVTNFNDSDCFTLAAQNCSPAKVTNTAEINAVVNISKMTTYYEIKGMQDGKCQVYQKSMGGSIALNPEYKVQMASSGMSSEQIQQIEQQTAEAGKNTPMLDGICVYQDTAKLVNMVNKWKTNSLAPEDFEGVTCKGEYFGQPGQKANTSTTISSDDCMKQNGSIGEVTDAGNACYTNQIDLGSIVVPSSTETNGKVLQCCLKK